MKPSRTGLILAVAATLFAGVFIGVGNMIHLSVAGNAGAVHEHHGGHPHEPATAEQPVLAAILTLPAHCLFCLDGMVPQPVSLAERSGTDTARVELPPAARLVPAVIAPAWRIHHCREPPSLHV